MEHREEKFSRNTAILFIGNNRYIYRRDRDAELDGKVSFNHVFLNLVQCIQFIRNDIEQST